MKKAGFAVLTAAALMAFSGPVSAELIHGQITNIDQQNNSVTLQPRNRAADMPGSIQLKVEPSAFQQNRQIQSLGSLSVGEEIVVEADRQGEGEWKAQSLLSARQISPARAGRAGAPGVDDADFIVSGRLVSKDPETNQIIVTDYATGYDLAFTVMDVNALQDIQPGDEVTLQADGGSQAQGVQKGQMQQSSGQTFERQGSAQQSSQGQQAGQPSQGRSSLSGAQQSS